MVKALDDVGIRWLTRVIQAVWRDKKIPDEWKESVMVPIFKKKGNIHECGNYRGIKLLSHCMKIMERIIDARIREIVEHQLGEEQFGFRKGVGTTDPLFISCPIFSYMRIHVTKHHQNFLCIRKVYQFL